MYGVALRVRCNGVLGADSAVYEAFSFGFMLSSPSLTIGNQPGVESKGDSNIRDNVVSFFGRPGSKIGQYAALREVVVSVVSDDDTGALRQFGDSVRWQVNQRGNLAQSNAQSMPPQVALAVSLGTGLPGPSARGRFYLPLPQVFPQVADGLVAVPDVQAVADSVRLLREDMKGDGFTLSVNSRRRGLLPVTSIRVGRALDTIRSRRTNMRESYVSSAALSS